MQDSDDTPDTSDLEDISFLFSERPVDVVVDDFTPDYLQLHAIDVDGYACALARLPKDKILRLNAAGAGLLLLAQAAYAARKEST